MNGDKNIFDKEQNKMKNTLDNAANKINEGNDTKSKDETNIKSEVVEKAPENIKDTGEKKPAAKKSKKQQSEFDFFRDFVVATKTAIRKPNGELYIKAEAWLYLAHLKKVTPSVTVIPVYGDFGHITRCTAVCKLYNEKGEEVSQATMIATKDEEFLKNLDDYAVMGMAETRAITRAIRNVYGYVVKGAGFESTPAVEMGLEKDMEL